MDSQAILVLEGNLDFLDNQDYRESEVYEVERERLEMRVLRVA